MAGATFREQLRRAAQEHDDEMARLDSLATESEPRPQGAVAGGR
jgi:hypothetical protein